MSWCFNTPKAIPLSYVTSSIKVQKIKIVALLLNVLDYKQYQRNIIKVN